MDFLFILFLFFFSISYCPTTVWNYDFDSNSDLACLKCRGTQIRIYLYIDTDTDTYTDAKCEMHTPCTESKSNEKWIGCDTKSRLHLARYLALGCSVPVQAILLARSMVRGPWSIHGPLCIALLLSLLQFFFFSFFFCLHFCSFRVRWNVLNCRGHKEDIDLIERKQLPSNSRRISVFVIRYNFFLCS